MIKRTAQEILGPLNRVEEKTPLDVLYLEGDEGLFRTGVRVCVIGTRKPSTRGGSMRGRTIAVRRARRWTK